MNGRLMTAGESRVAVIRVIGFLLLAGLCGASGAAAQSSQQGPAAALGLPPGARPVVVRVSFHLADISKVDEEAEEFEFTGVLTLAWHDPRRAFDPAGEAVDEKLYQGEYQFNELSPAWYPQVVLANESGAFEVSGVLLRVKPDGACTLIQKVGATAKTKLTLRRYPFDRQRLEAVFEVLGFDSSEVVLDVKPASGSWTGLRWKLPQWELCGTATATRRLDAPYVGANGSSSALVVSVTVRRDWLFMVRLVVLPLALIVLLSWTVFWMDRSSLGDRMAVSFVGVLTAVAFQSVVSGVLPRISEVTLIHSFLNVSFWIMCATVPINLLVSACDRRGDAVLGDRIDRTCRWAFPAAYLGLLALAVGVMFLCF